jgi:hypothetical protein
MGEYFQRLRTLTSLWTARSCDHFYPTQHSNWDWVENTFNPKFYSTFFNYSICIYITLWTSYNAAKYHEAEFIWFVIVLLRTTCTYIFYHLLHEVMNNKFVCILSIFWREKNYFFFRLTLYDDELNVIYDKLKFNKIVLKLLQVIRVLVLLNMWLEVRFLAHPYEENLIRRENSLMFPTDSPAKINHC